MTNVLSGNRRYLALWLPWLSVERLKHSRESGAASPDAPVALIEKARGVLRLAAVDRAAAALGLRTGLALADARVAVPKLQVFDHDPRADALLLDRLADGCTRYTPHVAIDGSDALVLDISGCTHLFDSEAALLADVKARLGRLGLKVRAAFAYAPDAALALARFRRASVAGEARAAVMDLPVAALRLDRECETALCRAGLKTVGDAARRPLAAIAARFGEGAVQAIRRILGEEASPLIFRTVEAPLVFDRRFAEPVARTDYALERLAELAAEAMAELGERGQGGRQFEALFFRSDGLTRRLAVQTGSATRDVEAVMRLFRERIETLDDPLDPGFGYDMVRFTVPLSEPLAAGQLRLEGGETSRSQQVEALIDRLSTRLGPERVQRFRPRDGHIPEQAQRALPAVEAGFKSAEWNISPPGNPPLRPLHLFDPPQPIQVVAEVPDGPPHRFRWRKVLHEVSRFEGPERIASEWWRAKDGNPAHGAPTRDYYRVEDRNGRRFWIFRHGFYGGGEQHPGWYLHGLFA
ncbi:Y-family DNA polymerase [Allosphingosinicella indica]|uniref:Protein ImuB n=1 Tax=Allosphingosinicella indica TaxID=941907 RepID=A0A1X7GIC4_9SPHN|nr:DNA polymerase Y family protein [Allosphingosinicella indica]SMF69889.1 protein ImuB [Allosphingosinicella indica]